MVGSWHVGDGSGDGLFPRRWYASARPSGMLSQLNESVYRQVSFYPVTRNADSPAEIKRFDFTILIS
jgi:hypothetical protein